MQDKYLEILDLQPGATMAEIKEAYAKLSKHFHPDNNKEDYAEERFIAVNEAYNFLLGVGPISKNSVSDEGVESSDPETEEYAKWRRQAKAFAKKRAKEVEKMQQEMIKSMLVAFNIFLGAMILFNGLLVSDYFLPREKTTQLIGDFKRVKEVAVNSNGDIISDYKYDQLLFDDFILKLDATQNIDFAALQQVEVLTTPIFNNPIEANINGNNEGGVYTHIGNVYNVFGYVFPLAFLLVMFYFFVLKKLNQKLTLSLIIVVLFVFQLSVFFIKPI